MDRILIIGGTGSLGKTLIKHLEDDYSICAFSRDEAKHVALKRLYPDVDSFIGDIRDYNAIESAIFEECPDIIINAAALKNVPEVEERPIEGIKTSLIGTENLITAARKYHFSRLGRGTLRMLTVSTDKACKPVNSYGMAKALQERLHIRAHDVRYGFFCHAVRYGNVLESRGSLIPLLKDRIKNNQPIQITHKDMTRFFLTLDDSVELIKKALGDVSWSGGKVYVPAIRSAKIVDVVDVIKDYYPDYSGTVEFTGIRPGEKLDEIMVSKEEATRTERRGNTFIIHDILSNKRFNDIADEYSSGSPDILMNKDELKAFLIKSGVL